MKFVKTTRVSNPARTDKVVPHADTEAPPETTAVPPVGREMSEGQQPPQAPRQIARKIVPKSVFPRMAMSYRPTRSGRGVH